MEFQIFSNVGFDYEVYISKAIAHKLGSGTYIYMYTGYTNAPARIQHCHCDKIGPAISHPTQLFTQYRFYQQSSPTHNCSTSTSSPGAPLIEWLLLKFDLLFHPKPEVTVSRYGPVDRSFFDCKPRVALLLFVFHNLRKIALK